MWRDEYRVYQSPTDAAEAAALATLRAGGTFGDACAALAASSASAAQAGALLLRWLDDHLLAAPLA